MKSLKLTLLAAALCCGFSAQAQTNTIWQQMIDTAKQFVANNPTNTWDASVYALANRTDKFGYGGGARVGYWMNPSVGAALDVNWCDHAWTFTSLGLTARGTINVGTVATVSPYGTVGAGWNIHGADQTVVAVVGTGGVLHINGFDWFDIFSEYQKVTLSPDSQQRLLLGITRKF
jgi:ABC-type amino acid transport substrate-binding protein